ncbi:MAG: type II toxin-antitoxin system Phd/YefM family antitoxin [Deltaproteobacteria bacterium]|nr:type II toxin-antitoxin system Phd/YefM family antitoxin [Deltaproteobacteria bacterium]
MHKLLSVTEARQQFLALAATFEHTPGVVEVTKRGKPVMVILPIRAYESLQEMAEITLDRPLLASIRRGLDDARRGRVRALRTVRKQLRI